MAFFWVSEQVRSDRALLRSDRSFSDAQKLSLARNCWFCFEPQRSFGGTEYGVNDFGVLCIEPEESSIGTMVEPEEKMGSLDWTRRTIKVNLFRRFSHVFILDDYHGIVCLVMLNAWLLWDKLVKWDGWTVPKKRVCGLRLLHQSDPSLLWVACQRKTHKGSSLSCQVRRLAPPQWVSAKPESLVGPNRLFFSFSGWPHFTATVIRKTG